ncbi:MAG: hypothetical protein AB8G22_19530 [Saprospiraceae bacterium]
MGVTIHYSARLRDTKDLPQLVAEITDICKSLDWKYHLVENDTYQVTATDMPLEPGDGLVKSIQLNGILACPPKCEPLWLVFTPSGRTTTPIQTEMANMFASVSQSLAEEDESAESEPTEPDTFTDGMVYNVFTKTQYAGAETHIALVKLLRYLEKKYFQYLRVTDEGKYWETSDENKLRLLMNSSEVAINLVRGTLEKTDFSKLEGDSLVDKVESVIAKLLKEMRDKD